MEIPVDEAESEVGVSTLVGGIVDDARRLLVQQLTLFQVEIKNDVQRGISAMVPMVLGAVIVIPGLLLLGMAAVYGLCTVAPDLPLWAAFGIIGGPVTVVGALLVVGGALALRTVHPTPDIALKGLKENLQWKTKK